MQKHTARERERFLRSLLFQLDFDFIRVRNGCQEHNKAFQLFFVFMLICICFLCSTVRFESTNTSSSKQFSISKYWDAVNHDMTAKRNFHYCFASILEKCVVSRNCIDIIQRSLTPRRWATLILVHVQACNSMLVVRESDYKSFHTFWSVKAIHAACLFLDIYCDH